MRATSSSPKIWQAAGCCVGLAYAVASQIRALGNVLASVAPQALLEHLHKQVRAEHRRKALAPELLPVGVIAVDGKTPAVLSRGASKSLLRLWGTPAAGRRTVDDDAPRGDHQSMRLYSAAWPCAALVAATIGGCADEFHPETDPDASGTIDGAPPCLEGEFAVGGQLDGTAMDVSIFGLSSEQADPAAGARGYFLLRDGPGVVLRLEMEQTPARGHTVAAIGWVDLVARGGPSAGQCDNGVLDGRYALSADGAVHTFSLGGLHVLPPCSGVGITGELLGCYRDEAVH